MYGEAIVTFVYYYKYLFFFIGEFEGKIISISIGGSADDIYELEIESSMKYKIKELSVSYATIRKDNTIIAEFTGAQ